jgi:hypothetical protein
MTLLLSGCTAKTVNSVNIELGNIPFAWTVPNKIASHLTVEIPHNDFSRQAEEQGAQKQALVYYTPDKGDRTVFMAAYYFPVNSYLAANRADEPPAFGTKVIENNGMVLSIAGPQDSIYDPQLSDGKNVIELGRIIYLSASYIPQIPKAVNVGELDSVSSWTTSVAAKALQNLASTSKLSPASIYAHVQALNAGFPDGDAGIVTQTLRGSKISFTLNKTSISKFLYLDSSMNIRSTDLVATDSPQPIVGCFAASLKNDRFSLKITSQSGLDVNGIISLKNSKKDSSFGDFVGTFDGTILTGIYIFNSEGVQSKRELFFRATPQGFLEGFGPVKVVGDSSKFSRPLSLTWNQSYIYTAQANCAK